jgi:opacity protein-like surface antigen
MTGGIAMRKSLQFDRFRGSVALVAALALVSLGVSASVAWADEPVGEDIVVPAPARPAPPPPAPPPAAEENFHLYVSGYVGGSFAEGKPSGSIYQAVPFGGTIVYAQSGSDKDADTFGGGALGIQYDHSPVGVRVELEGQAARDYRLETDLPVLAAPPNIVFLNYPTLDTSLNTWTLFGNIWLDVPITEWLSIFGGGGMGIAVTDMTSIVSPGLGDQSGDDTTFAWQVGGGLSFAATDWLTFDTSYRFVDLGQPDLKYRVYAFPSDLEMQLHSHDVVFGVRMNFFSF